MQDIVNGRCGWCGTDEQYVKYHDQEWGKLVTDDKVLFEFLVLESAQAGLSWITILKKREGYRNAFCNFDVQQVAQMTDDDIERLMQFDGIVKNRLKIKSTITNARQFLTIQKEFGSFYDYTLSFFPDRKPIINSIRSLSEIPASTPVSDAMSKDMKKRGFKFFGTTICYAHLQASGFINDHLMDCICREEEKRSGLSEKTLCVHEKQTTQYIETQRLILRSWQEKDIPHLARLNSDDKVMAYFPQKISYKETIALYNQIQEEFIAYGFGAYAVEEKKTGVFIGFVGLHNVTFKVDFAPAVEILWRLLPEFWGKGYATEAAIACLNYAKDELNLQEIVSFTSLSNKRSEHVMQKISMTRIKEFNHPLVEPEDPLSKHILYKIGL